MTSSMKTQKYKRMIGVDRSDYSLHQDGCNTHHPTYSAILAWQWTSTTIAGALQLAHQGQRRSGSDDQHCAT